MKGSIRENIEKTTNGAEKAILEYLEKNASEELKAKMQNSDKEISDCLQFIADSVRKQAVNGCACVSDPEVFGLAVHYFEEDSIKKFSGVATSSVQTSTMAKPVDPKPVAEKKTTKQKVVESGQMSMFDMLGIE